MRKHSLVSGFTLIEVITAIVLIAIIMIPIALMAQEYVRSVAYSDFQAQAINLARREMAIVNNLNYYDPTLADGYDNTAQNYAGYDFDLKRMVNYVSGTNNNLKRVRVMVSPHGSAEKTIELAAYLMNVQFGAGSGGGIGADESGYFLALGGVLQWDQLSDVALQNTNVADNITITGVVISSSRGRTLTSITMDGQARFSGSITLNPGVTGEVVFQNNFIMNPDTTYPGSQGGNFLFTGGSSKQSLTFTVIFVFSDGSQSMPYSWTYAP